MDIKNLSNVRQSFGNAVYNWKIHEVSSEKLNRSTFSVKVVNLVLVSAVLLFLLVQIIPGNVISEEQKNFLDYGGSVLSVLEIIFFMILLSFDFEEKSSQHKKTALNFRSIRDKYINLITDIINEVIGDKEIIQKRNSLLSEFQTICNLAPQTSRGSYIVTRNRLKPFFKKSFLNKTSSFLVGIFKGKAVNEEDFTLSDEEIDMFLPEGLKMKNLK